MPPFGFMKKVANAAANVKPDNNAVSVLQQVASTAVSSAISAGASVSNNKPDNATVASAAPDVDLGQVIRLASDSNAKTVARSLKSAQDYLAKPRMSSQALRELERAKTYLAKMDQSSTVDGTPIFAGLQALFDRLNAMAAAQQDEEAFDRIMVQVSRYQRYTQEAMDKKNANEATRHSEQWKKYVQQLPASGAEGPQAELNAALATIANLALANQHASTVRQLEREIKSARDVVTRAGGSMTEEALEPYLAKCRTTLEKLPTELQEVYQSDLEALQFQVTSTARQPEEAKATPKATAVPMTSFADKKYTSASGASPSTSGSATSAATTTTAGTADAPAGASDLNPNKRRVAERCLNGARDMLDRDGELDRVMYQIEYLAKLMEREAWPEAHQAEFRPIMAQLEAEVEAASLQRGRARLWKSIENAFERMQRFMDDDRRQGDALKERIEHEIDTVNRLAENEKHLLSDEQLDSLPVRIAGVREATKVLLAKYQLKDVERLVQRYVDLSQDPSDATDSQRTDAYRRNATEALERLPEDVDPSTMQERINEADKQIRSIQQGNQNRKLLGNVQYEFRTARCQNFKAKMGPSFETWLKQGRLQMDGLYEAVDRAQAFLKCREVSDAIKRGMEDDIRDMIDAANRVVETGSATLVETIKKLTQAADITQNPEQLAHELSFLSKQIDDFKGTKESVSQCKSLIKGVQQQIKSNLNAEKDAEQQAKKQRADYARSVFAPCLEAYQGKIMELDTPSEVVKSSSSYKGKFIRLTGRSNRMNWDFEQDGHNLILRVNGIPLCAAFDKGLAAQAKEMENKWDPNGYNANFDDVIIELTGGTATARPFTQIHVAGIREWKYLPHETAIHGKIVAFVRGPQAAGILQGKVVTTLN